MKDERAFTLAEILGIIVLIGVLMILVGPTIVNQLNSKKNVAKEAGNKLIYMATSEYMTEKQYDFPPGKKYCLKIQDLINAGKLSSPVIQVDTGDKLDNSYVLAYIYSSGDEYYEILSPSAGASCTNAASLPMIDFIVSPDSSTWAPKKYVEILYPSGSTNKQYKKDNGSLQAKNDTAKIEFTSNGTLVARAKYGTDTIESKINIGKIDGTIPTIEGTIAKPDCNNSNKVNLSFKDEGGSNLKSYMVSTSSSKPTSSASGWKAISSSPKTVDIAHQVTDNGTYYVYVMDNALNISSYKSFTSKIKNTITFNANGGSITSGSSSVTGVNGNKYSFPTVSRSEYDFLGWYTASSGGTKKTTSDTICLDGNQTLYAQWKQKTYSITAKAHSSISGSAVKPSATTAAKGTKVTFTVPSLSGFTYTGATVRNSSGGVVATLDSGTKYFTMPGYAVYIYPKYKYSDSYIFTKEKIGGFTRYSGTAKVFDHTDGYNKYYVFEAYRGEAKTCATDAVITESASIVSDKSYNMKRFCSYHFEYAGEVCRTSKSRDVKAGLVSSKGGSISSGLGYKTASMASGNQNIWKVFTSTFTPRDSSYYLKIEYTSNSGATHCNIYDAWFTGCSYDAYNNTVK